MGVVQGIQRRGNDRERHIVRIGFFHALLCGGKLSVQIDAMIVRVVVMLANVIDNDAKHLLVAIAFKAGELLRTNCRSTSAEKEHDSGYTNDGSIEFHGGLRQGGTSPNNVANLKKGGTNNRLYTAEFINRRRFAGACGAIRSSRKK